MYEDCLERFSCNRAPDKCSPLCYKTCKTHKKVTKVIKHREHCEQNPVANLRYVEGPPGRDGEDGRSVEFEWEGTRVKTRLEGEDNWTYSPNLQGIQGQQGPQGYTPYVGENGNWHINGEDLGINAYSQIVIETAKDSEKLGGQEPSYYAKDSEVQTLNTGVQTLNTLGSSGIVDANSPIFDVTIGMVGKRIMCTGNNGRRINLPSPVTAGKGAIIEIHENHSNGICEIYTEDGKIYKGGYNGVKCAQPFQTIRKYISTGYNWITNFCKMPYYVSVSIRIDPNNGSNDEPKYSGNSRMFASLNDVDALLREFSDIRITIAKDTTVTLEKNLTFKDCFLGISGDIEQYNSYLIVPSAYKINLFNVTLGIDCLTILTEGTVFFCTGRIEAVMGGYYQVRIRPNSNISVYLFETHNITPASAGAHSNKIDLSLGRCYFSTANVEGYSNKLNVFRRNDWSYNRPTIFINQSAGTGWGSKDANCFWYDGSDTLSRIGTSAIYTVG